jgi:hypothetical protein
MGAAQDQVMKEITSDRRPPWAWLFVAQLALVIVATVLAASGRFPTVLFRPPVDKLGHMLAWGGLAFFGVAFFGRARRWRVIATLLVAATLEELSQGAFPTRTFDLGDLTMNVAGIAAFGAALPELVIRPRSRRPWRCLPRTPT